MSRPATRRAADALWRALSDPTRRQILDLLRARPRTTGELAEAFPTSRFAVMKHIGVLCDAGLVVSRRRGRERWNHLNPLPIKTIHDRWIGEYARYAVDKLAAMKAGLEGPADR